MIPRLMFLTLLSATVFHLTSCSGDPTMPVMAGNNQAAIADGEKLYQEGRSADEAGKASKAIKLYDKMATRYPFAPNAPQARFRQAELLEQRGETLKSFDAYDLFLTQFQGSGMYTTALNRQIAMAQAAADGDVKQSMLGLKTRLSIDKTVEMLGKVRDNAPKSAAASRAQFTIGQLYEGKKKYKKAIEAYRLLVRDQPGSKEAPEALYRVGIILTEEADRGNQSRGNLDLAKEAFNDYLIQYPGRSHDADAKRKIADIESRDIQRSYDIAVFYQKTGKIESAKVYYRDIVKNTSHGELHDKAVAHLKELGE